MFSWSAAMSTSVLIIFICCLLHVVSAELSCVGGGAQCNVTLSFSAGFCKDKVLMAGNKLSETTGCPQDADWNVNVVNAMSADITTPIDIKIFIFNTTKIADVNNTNYEMVMAEVGEVSVSVLSSSAEKTLSSLIIPDDCRDGNSMWAALPCHEDFTTSGVSILAAVAVDQSDNILGFAYQTGQQSGFQLNCTAATNEYCDNYDNGGSFVINNYFVLCTAALLALFNLF